MLGFDAKKGKKFALEGALTAESVTSFAESVAEGTAVPKLKSAPVPEDNMDDDVAIVVGKTFDSIVKDTSKVRSRLLCSGLAGCFVKVWRSWSARPSIPSSRTPASCSRHKHVVM